MHTFFPTRGLVPAPETWLFCFSLSTANVRLLPEMWFGTVSTIRSDARMHNFLMYFYSRIMHIQFWRIVFHAVIEASTVLEMDSSVLQCEVHNLHLLHQVLTCSCNAENMKYCVIEHARAGRFLVYSDHCCSVTPIVCMPYTCTCCACCACSARCVCKR